MRALHLQKGRQPSKLRRKLDELLILEALIEILDAAAAVGASVLFRWVRRNIIPYRNSKTSWTSVCLLAL
jgi:hypothetical protein